MGDKFFDAIEKAKEDRLNFGQNLLEHFEKGKRAQIGEVRDWGGKKFRKTATGWVPVANEHNIVRGHSEISKMSTQGVKSAIKGLSTIATTVKDEGGYFSIKFDENDWNTYGGRSVQIGRIADYLANMTRMGTVSDTISIDDKTHTMKVYKETPSPEAVKSRAENFRKEISGLNADSLKVRVSRLEEKLSEVKLPTSGVGYTIPIVEAQLKVAKEELAKKEGGSEEKISLTEKDLFNAPLTEVKKDGNQLSIKIKRDKEAVSKLSDKEFASWIAVDSLNFYLRSRVPYKEAIPRAIKNAEFQMKHGRKAVEKLFFGE